MAAPVVDTTEVEDAGRYQLSVWSRDLDPEPIHQHFPSMAEAAAAALWAHGDTAVYRTVTTDCLTGVRVAVWSR